MGLHEQDLKDEDFKDLLLKEYTFLKRPVIIYQGEIFVGNSRKNIATLKQLMFFE
jgi:arsenate reductase-like glutaredoxin family protein